MNRTHTHIDVENGSFISLPKDGTDYPPVNADINNLIIYGKSVQDGEPTPDNPVEIKTVPSELDITSCGRNLLNDRTLEAITTATVTFNANNVRLTKATQTLYLTAVTPYNIYLLAGNDYHISFSYRYSAIKLNPGASYITLQNTDNSANFERSLLQWDSLASRTYSGTITITKSGYYRLRLYPYNGGGGFTPLDTGDYAEFTDLQINYGNAQQPYSPYNGSTTPITLRDTDGNLHTLKSLPDGTRDEVDLDGGESVDRVKRLVVTSGVNFSYYSQNETICRAIIYDNSNGFSPAKLLSGWCNYGVVTNDLLTPYGVRYYAYSSGTALSINIPKAELSSLDNAGVQEWIDARISAHGPFIFDYEYANPIPWTLHPDEQKKIITVDSDKAYIYTNAEVQPTLQCEIRKLGNRAIQTFNWITESGDKIITEDGDYIMFEY